jgi:imidazoleglycerol phosphate dehydratase HisB
MNIRFLESVGNVINRFCTNSALAFYIQQLDEENTHHHTCLLMELSPS